MAMGVMVEFFGIEKGFIIVGATLLLACGMLAIVTLRTPELRR
jgi:hypothetical protein